MADMNGVKTRTSDLFKEFREEVENVVDDGSQVHLTQMEAVADKGIQLMLFGNDDDLPSDVFSEVVLLSLGWVAGWTCTACILCNQPSSRVLQIFNYFVGTPDSEDLADLFLRDPRFCLAAGIAYEKIDKELYDVSGCEGRAVHLLLRGLREIQDAPWIHNEESSSVSSPQLSPLMERSLPLSVNLSANMKSVRTKSPPPLSTPWCLILLELHARLSLFSLLCTVYVIKGTCYSQREGGGTQPRGQEDVYPSRRRDESEKVEAKQVLLNLAEIVTDISLLCVALDSEQVRKNGLLSFDLDLGIVGDFRKFSLQTMCLSVQNLLAPRTVQRQVFKEKGIEEPGGEAWQRLDLEDGRKKDVVDVFAENAEVSPEGRMAMKFFQEPYQVPEIVFRSCVPAEVRKGIWSLFLVFDPNLARSPSFVEGGVEEGGGRDFEGVYQVVTEKATGEMRQIARWERDRAKTKKGATLEPEGVMHPLGVMRANKQRTGVGVKSFVDFVVCGPSSEYDP